MDNHRITLSQAIEGYFITANARRLSPHTLADYDTTFRRFRHTFAMQLLRNGGNIFASKRMLGHSSLKMVDVYLDIAQADVEAAHQEASPVTNGGL